MAVVRSPWSTDHGHTITRAQRGLESSQRLADELEHTPKEQAIWDQIVGYWRTQLGFAEKKGRK